MQLHFATLHWQYPSVLFRDKGMKFIVGKDWRDLFDVVIVQAEKPNFFNDKRRWVFGQ